MVKIKIDMPKSCKDCPCDYDYLYCSVTETPFNGIDFESGRLPDCPLEEVPAE